MEMKSFILKYASKIMFYDVNIACYQRPQVRRNEGERANVREREGEALLLPLTRVRAHGERKKEEGRERGENTCAPLSHKRGWRASLYERRISSVTREQEKER